VNEDRIFDAAATAPKAKTRMRLGSLRTAKRGLKASPNSETPNDPLSGTGGLGVERGATFDLPFPPRQLSPNARLHWRALAKAKKAYKSKCAWSLFGQPAPVFAEQERIPLRITISPPDNRRRDRDNLQHSLKYALDELACHLGVNDYYFEPTYSFGDPVKGGRVVISIGGAA
jgi:crossover junction endodeoxyribonuclease RusA